MMWTATECFDRGVKISLKFALFFFAFLQSFVFFKPVKNSRFFSSLRFISFSSLFFFFLRLHDRHRSSDRKGVVYFESHLHHNNETTIIIIKCLQHRLFLPPNSSSTTRSLLINLIKQRQQTAMAISTSSKTNFKCWKSWKSYTRKSCGTNWRKV